MAKGDKLNGSVDLLAKAMRKVFVEAVQEGTKPLREDIATLKSDMDGVKTDLKRMDTDMQNGFAELRPPTK